MIQPKDPKTGLILGVFLGGLGVDRFYKGDIGLLMLKLLSIIGFGIWSIDRLIYCVKGH